MGNLLLHNIHSSLPKLKWKLYFALKVNPPALCVWMGSQSPTVDTWWVWLQRDRRIKTHSSALKVAGGRTGRSPSRIAPWLAGGGRSCSLCRAVFTTSPLIYSLSATPRFWGFNLSSARCSLICLAHIYGFQLICLWLLSRLNSRSELSALMIVFIDFARSGAANMIQSTSSS